MSSVNASVRNCQLDSSRTRAGIQFRDFVLYLKWGIPGSVDEQLVVNFKFQGKSESEEDVEAIQDHGQMFGIQIGSPGGRYGWVCTESSNPAVDLGASQRSFADLCPRGSALSWQIEVTAGIYDVKVYTSGKV